MPIWADSLCFLHPKKQAGSKPPNGHQPFNARVYTLADRERKTLSSVILALLSGVRGDFSSVSPAAHAPSAPRSDNAPEDIPRPLPVHEEWGCVE